MQTIENDRVYSLSEIVRLKLVPDIKSYPTLHAEVLRDAAKPVKERVLNATIIGEGRARVIRIKGANLAAYVEERLNRNK